MSLIYKTTVFFYIYTTVNTKDDEWYHQVATVALCNCWKHGTDNGRRTDRRRNQRISGREGGQAVTCSVRHHCTVLPPGKFNGMILESSPVYAEFHNDRLSWYRVNRVNRFLECRSDNKHRINPLDSKDNYSATSNNTKLVHWPLTGVLLHLVQRGEAMAGCGPAHGVSSSLYQM